ncbi:MAG: hydroxymethylglutaryl-CoA synthase [Candidatus Methanofastidiosa archaeon]|nr:hydroxymethylglutaryl-CoA synthase [Candidatus Methanofastidiosa archaeon]
MKTIKDIGIVGYGAYVPMYRIKNSDIARVWGNDPIRVPVKEKSVPGPDEDACTIACEAARNAILRAALDPKKLGAVWVGTESKPYAVKPTATIVAEVIGATPLINAADWEFACKAGTEALQGALGYVGSGMSDYAMAIGVDTAQGQPADALEYTAAAGGSAMIVGPASEALATYEASCSFVTDTPDFWRRQYEHYPKHASRFTGMPAYFYHITNAAKNLCSEVGKEPNDFDYVIFHQPNAKFPMAAAGMLGVDKEKVIPGLISPYIGNTYAGSAVLGLAAVFDVAKPGDTVLCVSYGSGAGSDAFSFTMTDKIDEVRNNAPNVKSYIGRRVSIDYATYARYRQKIRM